MKGAFARTHIQASNSEAALAPLRFDYNRIADPAARTVAQEAAQEVRTLLSHTATLARRGKENAWRLGGALVRGKEHLTQHGEFEDWVKQEFGEEQFGDFAVDMRTAQRLMQLHRETDLQTLLGSKIGLSGFYLLTAKSTSEEVRQEALARDAAGERVTKAKIQEIRNRPQQVVAPDPEMEEAAPEDGAVDFERWRTAHAGGIGLLLRQVETYRRDAQAMGVNVDGYDEAIRGLELQRQMVEG